MTLRPAPGNLRPGQSLVEVLISVAFIAVVSSTVLTLLSGRLQSSTLARNNLRAATLSEEGVEAVKWLRDNGWDSLAPGTYGLSFVTASSSWRLASAPDVTDNKFTRTVTIVDTSETERTVTVAVNWQEMGRTQTVTLNTSLTNWRRIEPLLLWGDWTDPIVIGTLNIGAGNLGTAIAVTSSKAYLTSKATDTGLQDFHVIDVSDGTTPIKLGGAHAGKGLNEIVVSSTYAYVASSDYLNHLQLINISNPVNPTLTTSFRLSANTKEALSIGMTGNYVYLGTQSDAGPEFFVVDVTNPLSPVLRGSLEIGANITSISTLKDRVYLGTTHNTQEFIEINATTPTTPVIVKTLDFPGSNDVNDLHVNPRNYLAMAARTWSFFSPSPELVVVDLLKKDDPKIFGTEETWFELEVAYPADDLIFTSADISLAGFMIYQVSYPTNLDYYGGLNITTQAADLGFATNTVYAAVRDDDALQIITSTQ